MKYLKEYYLKHLNESNNWDKIEKHYVKIQLMRYMRLFGKQVRSGSDSTIMMNNQSIIFDERETIVRILFDFADASTQFLVDYFKNSDYLTIELRDKPYVCRVEFVLFIKNVEFKKTLLDSMKFVDDLIAIQKSEELKIYIAGNKFGI